MAETETIAYLIERRPQQTPTKYLGVNASNCDSEQTCSGGFAWFDHHADALRFARRLDAVLFIGALRALSEDLPHGMTLEGLRAGDPAPGAIEHVWLTNELGATVGPLPQEKQR